MTTTDLFNDIRRYLKADWAHFYGKKSARDWRPSHAYRVAFNKLYFGDTEHSDVEVGAYFDAIVGGAEAMVMDPESHIVSQANEMDLIIEPIEALHPTTVVDAGCGVGLTLGFLATRYPQTRFVGYDLSNRSIDRARQRIAYLGCKNVELFVASHEQAANRIKDANLVFTENSYSNRLELFAVGSQFPTVESWLVFAMSDRTTREYGMRLRWFAKMLAHSGTYLCVQPMLGDHSAIFMLYCKIVGLVKNETIRRLLPSETRDAAGYEQAVTDIMVFRKTGVVNREFLDRFGYG